MDIKLEDIIKESGNVDSEKYNNWKTYYSEKINVYQKKIEQFLYNNSLKSEKDTSLTSIDINKGNEAKLGIDKVNKVVKNFITFQNAYKDLDQIKKKEYILNEIKKLDQKIKELEKDNSSFTLLNDSKMIIDNLEPCIKSNDYFKNLKARYNIAKSKYYLTIKEEIKKLINIDEFNINLNKSGENKSLDELFAILNPSSRKEMIESFVEEVKKNMLKYKIPCLTIVKKSEESIKISITESIESVYIKNFEVIITSIYDICPFLIKQQEFDIINEAINFFSELVLKNEKESDKLIIFKEGMEMILSNFFKSNMIDQSLYSRYLNKSISIANDKKMGIIQENLMNEISILNSLFNKSEDEFNNINLKVNLKTKSMKDNRENKFIVTPNFVKAGEILIKINKSIIQEELKENKGCQFINQVLVLAIRKCYLEIKK